MPGFRLHTLQGDRAGQRSALAAGNWRTAFRFADGEAVDMDLIDYHRPNGVPTMHGIASDHVSPMPNPPHVGELIRESMDEVGCNVTETVAPRGCERGTLASLLNSKAGVSANMTLALEGIDWGTADPWMRMQARRDRAAAEGCPRVPYA